MENHLNKLVNNRMMITEEQVFESIRNDPRIKSIPQVLSQIIRVASDEKSSIHDLAGVVFQDPVLTSIMLKLSNSVDKALYGKISTIGAAVNILGKDSVLAAVLAISLYRLYQKDKYVIDKVHFWRHSIETAISCREIARLCRYKAVEEAFCIGLIHDIGFLLLEAHYPGEIKKIFEKIEKGNDLLLLEQKYLNTTHIRVGSYLLKYWNLPSFFSDAIAQHHEDVTEEKNIPESRLSRILMLANLISTFHFYPVPVLTEMDLRKISMICNSLNISQDKFKDFQVHIVETLLKESSFLDIKIGSSTELLEALNSVLLKKYIQLEKLLRDFDERQEQIAKQKMVEQKVEWLKIITNTLFHYINNTTAQILSESEKINHILQEKKGEDFIPPNKAVFDSTEIIKNSVQRISIILDSIKQSELKTKKYSNGIEMLDIEEKIKSQLE